MPHGKFGEMFGILKNTYQGKKVLLTGHTGFKGAWLLKILTMLGAEVQGYALEPENSFDLFNLLKGNTLCKSTIADLRDKAKLDHVASIFQPDFVFHLAAQPLVRLSYDIPVDTFEVNAIGTANLLNSLRALNKKCMIVLITTDKVYHNNEWPYPYRENDRLGGYDPYSASKACAELVIDSFRNSFFNIKEFNTHLKAIAVARAGNVIGGGDWAKDRLIPDVIRALSKNENINVRNPGSVRPWQHVLEPLLGYLMLGSRLSQYPQKYSQAYNFGPDVNDALPVSAMVEMAIEHWQSGQYVVSPQAGQPHEAGLLKLDISKTIAELGWKPKLNASEALRYTIDWYKEYNDNPQGIETVTEAQINKYIGL